MSITSDVSEWSKRLNETTRVDEQTAVLTEIINAMSGTRDLNVLFPTVVKLISTKDARLKKLVYIFLVNYASQNNGTCLLAVNALEQDASNTTREESEFTRSLAIRTMGSIATPEIAEYFCPSVLVGLSDADPFVRKTAATTVAKLFRTNQNCVLENGLISHLRVLLHDGNNIVIGSAAAALNSIREAYKLQQSSTSNVFAHVDLSKELPDPKSPDYCGYDEESDLPRLLSLTWDDATSLLTSLSANATVPEWTILSILDAISRFEVAPPSPDDAEVAVQRLIPFLRSGNVSVALAAVSLTLQYLSVVVAPPTEVSQNIVLALINMVSAAYTSPEVQWVALRALRLLIGSSGTNFISTDADSDFSVDFSAHCRLFFCKFNDPLYIKVEKIDILALIATEMNYMDIVSELRDYCRDDVDPLFIRKAVHALGEVAVRTPQAANMAVDSLKCLLTGEPFTPIGDVDSTTVVEGIQYTLPPYATQEIVTVCQAVFRRYPNRFEGIIAILCDRISVLDEPDARASLVWILGEYAGRIEGVDEVFADVIGIDLAEIAEIMNPGAAAAAGAKLEARGSFCDEMIPVQLAILTTAMKVFLAIPNSVTQAMLQYLLRLSTESAESPDVRQRAFFYWRLLTADPTLQIAKGVIGAQQKAGVKPVFSDGLPVDVKKVLKRNLGGLASILRQTPEKLELLRGKSNRSTNYEEEEEDEDLPVVPVKTADANEAGTAAGPNTNEAPVSPSELINPVSLPVKQQQQPLPMLQIPQQQAPVKSANLLDLDDLMGPVAKPQKPVNTTGALDMLSIPAAAQPAPVLVAQPAAVAPKQQQQKVDNIMDLAAAIPATNVGGSISDVMTMIETQDILPMSTPRELFAETQNVPVKHRDPNQALRIENCTWTRRNNKPTMNLILKNYSQVMIQGISGIMFSPNFYGITGSVNSVLQTLTIQPMSFANNGVPIEIPCTHVICPEGPSMPYSPAIISNYYNVTSKQINVAQMNVISFCLQTSIGPFYFQVKVPAYIGFEENVNSGLYADVSQMNSTWQLVPDNAMASEIIGIENIDYIDRGAILNEIERRFALGNFKTILKNMDQQSFAGVSSMYIGPLGKSVPIYLRAVWRKAVPSQTHIDIKLMVKVSQEAVVISQLVLQSVKYLATHK